MKIPLTPLRKELDNYIFIEKDVENFDSITLLERSKLTDHMNGINCIAYCFRESRIPKFKVVGDGLDFVALCVTGFREVRKPQVEDLVIYIQNEDGLKEQAHIGRYVRNNLVRSKWGYGNIYLHNLEFVPACYGDEVRFFRGIQEGFNSRV